MQKVQFLQVFKSQKVQFLHKISSILSRINRSAGSQSTERRVSFESQRAASCSRSFSSPETIVHEMQCCGVSPSSSFPQGIPSHPCSRRNRALSCEYFFLVSFWICAEDERSEVHNSRPVAQRQPGTPFLPLFSQIPLNIFNIQNLVSGLNAKLCKKSMSWDFIAGESSVINLLYST